MKKAQPVTWKTIEDIFAQKLEEEYSLKSKVEFTKMELLSVIHALTMRKAQNKNVWQFLMKPLLD